MSTFPRVALLVVATTLLSVGGLFVLLIAYSTGNLPDGSRLVYGGFSFYCRGWVAEKLIIDDPQQAEIYIIVRDQPVFVRQLSKDDFAALGFKHFVNNAFSNAPAGDFAFADFTEKQELGFLQIGDHPDLTIPFASANGKPLKLPLTINQIRAEFGAPVKTEWTYSTPQWR